MVKIWTAFEQRFGQQYLNWAAGVPRLLPDLADFNKLKQAFGGNQGYGNQGYGNMNQPYNQNMNQPMNNPNQPFNRPPY